MKRFILAVTLLVALCVIPAEAKVFKTNYTTSPAGWCSIKAGGGIGCESAAIPAFTDGFAWVRKRGRAHLGDTGDLIAPTWSIASSGNAARLRPGDRWNKRGIRCRAIAGGIKCSNGQHGFKLMKRSYRLF